MSWCHKAPHRWRLVQECSWFFKRWIHQLETNGTETKFWTFANLLDDGPRRTDPLVRTSLSHCWHPGADAALVARQLLVHAVRSTVALRGHLGEHFQHSKKCITQSCAKEETTRSNWLDIFYIDKCYSLKQLELHWHVQLSLLVLTEKLWAKLCNCQKTTLTLWKLVNCNFEL